MASTQRLSASAVPRLPTLDTRRVGAKPRTLVLCFDGTTNIFDDTNTNVVKLFAMLQRDNREEQMVYYQPGVGTYVPPGMLLPITLKLAKIVDQGIALFLDKHVMGGYEFLMKHYNDGDKICLFGFSRGAYTARALAGMLHKVGLLPPDNIEQISFAYQIYKQSHKRKVGRYENTGDSAGFKQAFCREVEIEFMGVWDTVSSVGLLIPRHLPHTKFNPIVKTFRHAVSLDERRAKFKHHLWHTNSEGDHYPKSPEGLESIKVAEPTFLSPLSATYPTASPVAALRPLPKLRGSNLKEAVDFTITEASTPTNSEISPDTAVGRLPHWVGEQSDNASPMGKHGQNLEVPSSRPWHPREETRVEILSSDVEKDVPKPSNTLDAGRTNTSLHSTKSEASLTSSVASERDVVGPELNKADNHFFTRFMNQMGISRAPRKRTASSGDVVYEVSENARAKAKKEWHTDVLEVWFAGGHGDIGGGAEKDSKKEQLSNVSLRWMIQQIMKSQCGIKFKSEALKKMHMSQPPASFGTRTPASYYSSPSEAEAAQQQENHDALAKPHDNLLNPTWWILEFIPQFHSSRDENGDKHTSVTSPNLFRGRRPHTYNGKIMIHKTVQYRMNMTDGKDKYRYKAHIADSAIQWVD